MKIFFVSLGCDKNLVDTEMMLGELVDAGHAIVDDENLADIAVINTCSFIHDAKEESINTIIELGELKEKGQLKAVIVCGCLAQRYADEIHEEIPEEETEEESEEVTEEESEEVTEVNAEDTPEEPSDSIDFEEFEKGDA